MNVVGETRECLECTEGMDCTEKGTALKTMKLEAGFWRPDKATNDVRECPKEGLCKGGVAAQICPEFNEGPYVSSQTHRSQPISSPARQLARPPARQTRLPFFTRRISSGPEVCVCVSPHPPH